ncbi:MAG TPA: NAD(P)/FAD-dependent oxidoreductase [Polyangiaceae bacterium]
MGQGESFDAVVVGASLAGCTAATVLARKGAKVALLERASSATAYKKVCTHFIQPSGIPTLERLGLLDAIRAAGGVKSGVSFHTQFGWLDPDHEFDGLNFRREKLDPMVRELAGKTEGVDLRMHHPVTELLRDGDRVAGVVTEHEGVRRELRAEVVVAADGRHSKVAQMAGIEGKTAPNNRFLYAAYFKNLDLPTADGSTIWFSEDASYVFPNDDGVTVAVVMPHKDKLPAFRADVEKSFYAQFEGLPRAPRLREAERVSDFFGMLEMPSHIRPAAVGRVALVGDAAMASDPVMGVGCGFALQSGEWLGEDLGEALAARKGIDEALATYRTHHDERLRMHHEMINVVSLARPFNFIERLIFHAATTDRAFARQVGRMNSRLAHPREIVGPGLLLRAVWLRLTRKVPARALT